MAGAASIFRYNENVSPVQLGNENGGILFDITEYKYTILPEPFKTLPKITDYMLRS
jgi:hypothetical protein